MALGEFGLIERFFARCGATRGDVLLGVGDDAALLRPPPGRELAVTADTLVEGVHFFADSDPEALGWKALAVNLSDLAAMGAEPAWATLAVTLPDAELARLEAFARGFCGLATRHQLALVGGDTTRGPFSLTIQLIGFVASSTVMRRDRARPGDRVYVTGTLGDAALGLHLLQQGTAGQGRGDGGTALLERLHRPTPRVQEAQWIARHARCAVDISDGLLADLGHICERSAVGAEIEASRLPLSPPVAAAVQERGDWSLPLSGGDDYELCFTLPLAAAQRLERDYPAGWTPLRCIGEIVGGEQVQCRLPDGGRYQRSAGYDHFG